MMVVKSNGYAIFVVYTLRYEKPPMTVRQPQTSHWT
jgi:hypothetical protein